MWITPRAYPQWLRGWALKSNILSSCPGAMWPRTRCLESYLCNRNKSCIYCIELLGRFKELVFIKLWNSIWLFYSVSYCYSFQNVTLDPTFPTLGQIFPSLVSHASKWSSLNSIILSGCDQIQQAIQSIDNELKVIGTEAQSLTW